MSPSVPGSLRFLSPIANRVGRIPVVISLGATFVVFSWLISGQWKSYQYAMDDANLRVLNELAACYTASVGKHPDVNLIDLYKTGMTDRRLQSTPLGGYYRYDQRAGVVYNPHRQESRPQVVQAASVGMK